MGYTAGGFWAPAPGITSWPTTRPAPARAPRSPSSGVPAPRSGTASEWGPSSLRGSRTLNVGGTRFQIPRSAQVKGSRRSGTVWVLVDGETYVLSELGELIQSAAERRATRWDLI